MSLTVGSLFSGIGGFDLGLEQAGMEISFQVERDEYCRKILQRHWPSVPCHYDITTIDWHFIPRVDLVCGGFPCQPFSCAGKRQGKDDDRYLWPEVVRCLAVLRPTWFLGENVPGLLHLGIEQVLADLEALGYETAVLGIPACAVDAPHIRQRLWICSYRASEQMGLTGQPWISGSMGTVHANSESMQREAIKRSESNGTLSSNGEPVSSDTNTSGRNGRSGQQRKGRRGEFAHGYRWPDPPALCRVDARIPRRVDRLRTLGNAIVPQIPEKIGRMILQVTQLQKD